MKVLPPIKYPSRIEGKYRAFLRSYIRELRDDILRAVQGETLLQRDDSVISSFRSLLDTTQSFFRAKWTEARLRIALTQIFSESNAYVDTRANRQWGADVAIAPENVAYTQQLLEAFVASNITLIRSIEERYFADVHNIVMGVIANPLTKTTAIRDIALRYNLSLKRAAFIVDDQMTKLTSALVRQRMLDSGLDKAIWVTQGDSRVRDSHRNVGGQVFDLNTGLEVGGTLTFPGQPPRCRCYAAPVRPGVRP